MTDVYSALEQRKANRVDPKTVNLYELIYDPYEDIVNVGVKRTEFRRLIHMGVSFGSIEGEDAYERAGALKWVGDNERMVLASRTWGLMDNDDEYGKQCGCPGVKAIRYLGKNPLDISIEIFNDFPSAFDSFVQVFLEGLMAAGKEIKNIPPSTYRLRASYPVRLIVVEEDDAMYLA